MRAYILKELIRLTNTDCEIRISFYIKTWSVRISVSTQDFHSCKMSSTLIQTTTSRTYYNTDSVCRNGNNISTLVAYIRSKSDTSFNHKKC